MQGERIFGMGELVPRQKVGRKRVLSLVPPTPRQSMAAKRKKKKTFSAAKAVKEVARNVIGSPRPTVRELPKSKKAGDKHKKTLSDLLSSEE